MKPPGYDFEKMLEAALQNQDSVPTTNIPPNPSKRALIDKNKDSSNKAKKGVNENNLEQGINKHLSEKQRKLKEEKAALLLKRKNYDPRKALKGRQKQSKNDESNK